MLEAEPLQVGERLARADPRERAPLIARQLAAQVVHEAGFVGPHRRQRHREDQVGDIVGAVVRDREQQERERGARVVVEPADQPEVEQREPPVRRQQHVSAVRIGVVEALDGHLADVRAEERACELRGTLLRQRVAEIDAFALDELQHHHLLGHERVDHLRDEEVVAVVVDHLGDQLRVVRLLAEVELAEQMLLELVRERVQLQELCGVRVVLGDRGRLAQEVEIEPHLVDDAGAPHLDDDLAAALQEGGVDLRDRCRRERRLVDPGEVLEPDLAVDHLAQRREGQRRHVVDELRQLVDVDVGQQVGSGREQLAELHERRPELFEALAEANGALARRRLVADDADLAEDLQQMRAARHARQFERAAYLALVGHRERPAHVASVGNRARGYRSRRGPTPRARRPRRPARRVRRHQDRVVRGAASDDGEAVRRRRARPATAQRRRSHSTMPPAGR